jgi:hypothetical protein
VLAPWPGLRLQVPWVYVEGLDWAFADEREGANVYLLGQLGKGGEAGRRFPEYCAVAWLYKEPIAAQLLLLLALGAYLVRFRNFDFRWNECSSRHPRCSSRGTSRSSTTTSWGSGTPW